MNEEVSAMNLFRVSTLLATATASLALGAMTAHAQEPTGDWRDSTYNGIYVSAAVGANAPTDRGTAITFDNNNDHVYGDTVRTSSGANAFSPGGCQGSYTSNSPATGCSGARLRPEYAGRVGLDVRRGHLVLGTLFEGTTNDSRQGASAFSTTPAAYRITRGLDYGFALRARAGWTPNGGGLFYATGGIGYARIKHNFRTTNTANQFTEYNPNAWNWGWQAGGGAEVMVTPRISIGAEYLYNKYRDNKYYVGVTQGTAPATNAFLLAGGQTNMKLNDKLTFHSVRATVSYHF
jgi:outer membrane immunogenic protein